MPTKKKASKKAVKKTASKAGYVKVEYGYPGRNGLKSGLVAIGSTHESALRQLGIEVNQTKEGILSKLDGSAVRYNDVISATGIFMICPGVDSSYRD